MAMICTELFVVWFKGPELTMMCRELIVIWSKEPELAMMCRELVVVLFNTMFTAIFS